MKFQKLLGGAALAVLLAGCGSGAPETKTGGAGAKKSEYTIALIAKSSTNPVFLSARTGAEAAAKELGEKNGVKITIDWRTPPQEDGQIQAQRLAQAVNEGADAVLLSCSDATKVNGAIDDAVAKGVPVMTFDSDAPDSKRFAFYGADDMEVGKQVMDELMKLTGGKGNVAILAGNQTAPNLQKRVAGVKEAAKAYPGAKIVNVFYHQETPQDAAAEVLRAMKAYPEINAWAMIGGWPLFTKSLLDLDPNKIKIVAVDCLPAQLPYIDKGVAPVLLAQPTFDWGFVGVSKIVDKLVLGKEVEPINKMELVRVSKENLGEWARQLKDWGFPEVPEEYLSLK